MRASRMGHGIGGMVLAGVVLAAVGSSRAATTYCVATNGNDAYPGTNWAQPFRTITNAVQMAIDGDTVLVTNGTYTYSANGLGNGAGLPILITKGITLRSVNGYAVTIIKPGSAYMGSYGIGAVMLSHTNAVLDGFRITGTTSGNVTPYAGGVCVASGLVQNCWIDNNTGYRGGGVMLSGAKSSATVTQAMVRNCVIVANNGTDAGSGCGGVYWSGDYAGIVDSCTIVKNIGAKVGGIYNAKTGGLLLNSIVHGNTAGGTGNQNFTWTASIANVDNCCITKDYTTGGTGNITNDPVFMDWNGGNYHLTPVSPCRDAGGVQAWMSGAHDLDGTVARIMPVVGGTNDIGCYEFNTDALIPYFTASPLYGIWPVSVTFTSVVSGVTNGLVYRWDIGADGSYEVTGANQSSLTTNLPIGTYSMALLVSNASSQVGTYTLLNYVKVGPATNYVDVASPGPVWPYSTWATASTNIQKALDVAAPGTLTLVATGTYRSAICITNNNGATLRSVKGYASTIIQGTTVSNATGAGCINVNHASAVVDGFTITGKGGSGVTLNLGLVQNCWLTGNYSYDGGGVYLSAGTVRNCLITGNSGADGGGGIWFATSTGLVENCTICGNDWSSSSGQGCGGVTMSAQVPSVAVIRNSIVYGNTSTGGGSPIQFYFYTTNGIDHCCIPTNYLTGAYGSIKTNIDIRSAGNVTNDPLFVNAAGGDCRLRPGSPCINAGTNQSWMFGALDLRGQVRIVGPNVDMGVFETGPRGTAFLFR